MVVVPGIIPVTTPVALFTVATAVLLLLHVPPVMALVSVVVVPGHICVSPILVTRVFTVAIIVVNIPGDVVYVMCVVPLAIPVSRPVVGCIVAIDVLLLLHVPPAVVCPSVAFVCPAHTMGVPVIDGKGATTVTTVTREQLPTVKLIVAVPTLIPFTVTWLNGEGVTVATLGLLLLHAPDP
jgi:hypothetical protein